MNRYNEDTMSGSNTELIGIAEPQTMSFSVKNKVSSSLPGLPLYLTLALKERLYYDEAMTFVTR